MQTEPAFLPTDERVTWRMVAQSINRPYRVTIPMIVLVCLVPLYIFIGESAADRQLHVPAIAWDRALPVQPLWALVYGPLYLFLILLPVFLVRDQEHIRRTVFAYLAVWLSAYAIFLWYPTVASRPAKVIGEGFAAWGLRFLYDADPPYNCFPSLHVAHSFVSALTCYRVHRGVGGLAIVCAALVALSTLFTKQHYVLDVVAGVALACAAYLVFLRPWQRTPASAVDRLVAPRVSLVTAGIVCGCFLCYWVAYLVKTWQ